MATHLLNILPTSTLSFRTPFEILYNTFPKYDNLRVFRCLCYPNVSATSPHKLAPRSLPCVFLGFPEKHRGFRCLDLSTNRIIVSRHVRFDEFTFPFSATPPSPSTSLRLNDNSESPNLATFLFPTVPLSNQPDPQPSASNRGPVQSDRGLDSSNHGLHLNRPRPNSPKLTASQDRGPTSVDRGPPNLDCGPTSVDRGPLNPDRGPHSTDRGPTSPSASFAPFLLDDHTLSASPRLLDTSDGY